MGTQVWTRLCNSPPAVEGGAPLDCAWVAVPAETYQTSGLTQDQVDAVMGGVIGLIATIIIFALLKKAIES